MNCDYKALETERVELVAEFNKLSASIKAFIDTSKSICSSDIWTGEAEKVYYGLISNVVDNLATVSDQSNNIDSYIKSVIYNYIKLEQGIEQGIVSLF